MPLTGSRNTHKKDGKELPFLVAANVKIYGGALVALNAAGYLVPGSTANNLTYVGRAEDTVDNTGGANGDQTAVVGRKHLFKFLNSVADPVGQADLGKSVYIVDDQTVAKTDGGGTRSKAGVLLGVEADGVWIE